jgi:hypothetical protein
MSQNSACFQAFAARTARASRGWHALCISAPESNTRHTCLPEPDMTTLQNNIFR